MKLKREAPIVTALLAAAALVMVTATARSLAAPQGLPIQCYGCEAGTPPQCVPVGTDGAQSCDITYGIEGWSCKEVGECHRH